MAILKVSLTVLLSLTPHGTVPAKESRQHDKNGPEIYFYDNYRKEIKKAISYNCNVKIINKNNNSCFKVPGRKDLENLTPPSWKLPPLGPPSHLYF